MAWGNMHNQDFTRIIELARVQLDEFRSRAADSGDAAAATEVERALSEIVEILVKVQAHYSLLHAVLARTSDSVFAKDRTGRYLMISPSGAALFRMSVADILGQDDSALFEPESAARLMAMDRRVMSSGQPSTFEETLDIRGISTRLLTTEAAWYEADGSLRGLIGSFQNVTNRRRLEGAAQAREERLRALASEIVVAEEGLRQRLAMELHEGLGQDLALTKLRLADLRDLPDAELRGSLSAIERLVEATERSLRSITFRLSPPSLHDLGLVAALKWLAEDVTRQYGLAVSIEDAQETLVADERLRVVLFRATRELLLNAATHSGAKGVVITLKPSKSRLRIDVSDDGRGFDVTAVEFQGYGLFGIREQLRHAGGSVRVDSVLGRGTRVTLSAPLVLQTTSQG